MMEEPSHLPGKDESEDLIKQCESLKRRLNQQYKWKLKPITIGLGLLGAIALLLGLLANDSNTAAMLLVPTGISLIALALLLYYLSPSRYLRDEVGIALMRTDTLNFRKMLTSLDIKARGIIMPGNQEQPIVLLLQQADPDQGKIKGLKFDPRGMSRFHKKKHEIWLDPPGFGLFAYTRSIGANFTEENLEEELREVMCSSLELVRRLDLKIEGDRATVRLNNMATQGMCSYIREEDSAICTQTGCPICSFVGCAIVDATGKKARAETVEETGKTIEITFELI
jgi:hypothetical protein